MISCLNGCFSQLKTTDFLSLCTNIWFWVFVISYLKWIRYRLNWVFQFIWSFCVSYLEVICKMLLKVLMVFVCWQAVFTKKVGLNNYFRSWFFVVYIFSSYHLSEELSQIVGWSQFHHKFSSKKFKTVATQLCASWYSNRARNYLINIFFRNL